jgi:AcrR family transcriptional regulator
MAKVAQTAIRRNQAQRSASTSALLIEATIQCLCERGYGATSTTLVAARAGVSRGAMLHHFATKVALLSSTVQKTYANDYEAYTKAFKNISSVDIYIDKLIDTAWECFRSPSGVAQTEIWLASRSDPELAAVVGPIHASVVEQAAKVLTRDASHYHYRIEVTMEALLCYIVSALRGLSLQQVLGTPEDQLAASIALIKSTTRSLLTQTDAKPLAENA